MQIKVTIIPEGRQATAHEFSDMSIAAAFLQGTIIEDKKELDKVYKNQEALLSSRENAEKISELSPVPYSIGLWLKLKGLYYKLKSYGK